MMRWPAAIALAYLSGVACDDGATARDAGAGHARGFDARTPMCEGGQTRTFYRDGDGDGFGIPGVTGVHGCAGDVFEGLADNGRDCDDSDPGKQQTLFEDADGDGFGSREAVCTAIDAGGFSLRSDDCDDGDPERSPGADEGWFDGHDANCDGQDDPAGCIAAPGVPRDRYATPDVIELPPLDSIPVDAAPDCDGAVDLYFAVIGGCPVCSLGIATVVVANAGSVPAAFRVTSNDESVDVTAELAPGEVAEPFWLRLQSPESAITVRPLDDVSDCRTHNDSRTVRVGFTDCEAQ